MTIDARTLALHSTEARRAQIREKAKQQGLLRTIEVRRKVEEAMTNVTEEMKANGGIYPHNKGSVSSAEVARRAGIHVTTLFSPCQKELGQQVKEWVRDLKCLQIVGRVKIRRTLSERIADWKTLYEGLAQSHRDTELELQARESELELVRAELQRLKLENTSLERLLKDNNVVSIYRSSRADAN